MEMEPITILKYLAHFKINNMKKTLLIIFLVSIVKFTKAQTIFDMAGSNNNLPENYLSNGQYYIKDVNTYLDNFIGTWEYANGNEKFQITLTKIIKYHTIWNDIKLNFYEDGIAIKYKKYINNNLIFESPTVEKPYFDAKDPKILDGYIIDYGRIAKTVFAPKINRVLFPGGNPMSVRCNINIIPVTANEPKKIKFHLFYRQDGMTGYDYETYAGQPIFSVPSDIIMTKVE